MKNSNDQHDDAPSAFYLFCRRAFRELTGESLGYQEYVFYLCWVLSQVSTRTLKRLLINLPPRHLKTFLGAVCLAAYELAIRPKSKIILVACSEQLAHDIARQIRQLLRSRWFVRTYGDLLDPKHSKLDDFHTKQGGGVYALPVHGAITGRGGDLIIFDDPLEIKHAGNIEATAKVNEVYDNAVQSRLNRPSQGRIVVIGHRLHDNDPCSHMLSADDFRHVVLPFVAPRSARYIIGNRVWVRPKGDILRPDEFSAKDVDRLRRQPLFPLLYQQGQDDESFPRLRPEHFISHPVLGIPPSPRVLSIDPGQKSGSRNSFSAILVWYPLNRHTHVLVDAWRGRCDYAELLDVYRRFCRVHRPSAVLIEGTALGPALISHTRRKMHHIDVYEIAPGSKTKGERLAAVLPIILAKGLHVLEGAEWGEEYTEDMLAFPSGPTDDWLDATTQYLAWIVKHYPVKVMPPRALAALPSGRRW